MKKLLLVTLFVALSAPASAADRVKLPAKFLGTWCFKKAQGTGGLYERGNCYRKNDSGMAIGPDGYEGREHECKTIGSTARKEGLGQYDVMEYRYAMHYRCAGEGWTWFEDSEMHLNKNGDLIVAPRRQYGTKEDK